MYTQIQYGNAESRPRLFPSGKTHLGLFEVGKDPDVYVIYRARLFLFTGRSGSLDRPPSLASALQRNTSRNHARKTARDGKRASASKGHHSIATLPTNSRTAVTKEDAP